MGANNGVIITITTGQGDDRAAKSGTLRPDPANGNITYSFNGQYFHDNGSGVGSTLDPNDTPVTYDVSGGAAIEVAARPG